ncbi:MAG: hypothetical protein ABIR51_04900 [Sphingomicrobium sp.]
MFNAAKAFIKQTPLAKPLIFLKGKFTRPHSQNDEAEVLAGLLKRYDVPKCFIEFGFSGWEFNCAPLAYEWDGLLVDGDAYNVTIATTILPQRVVAKQLWLTLETLQFVRDYAETRPIGILSIDVDGNDYWFLKKLIDLRPAIVISEYNSVFGLRSVTVPYDAAFDRRNYPAWAYYGASLSALTSLAERHGYALIAQTTGVNAFFVRQDLLRPTDQRLSATEAYQPRRTEAWEQIKHLPLLTV